LIDIGLADDFQWIWKSYHGRFSR